MTATEEELMADAEDRKKKRALELASDISDLVTDLAARIEEMNTELDLTAEEIHSILLDQGMGMPGWDIAYEAWAQVFPAAALGKGLGLERVLSRLFREAPKLEHADGSLVPKQTPTIPEAMVILRSGAQLQGALSMTPEKTLRIGVIAIGKTPEGARRESLLEQFFEVGEVTMVAIPRDLPRVSGGGSRIITGS